MNRKVHTERQRKPCENRGTWLGMCMALGVIPSTTKAKALKEEEFGAILLQIKAHLGPLKYGSSGEVSAPRLLKGNIALLIP